MGCGEHLPAWGLRDDRVPGTDQAVRGGRHGQKLHSGSPAPPPRQGDACGSADARSSADAGLSQQKVQRREANRRRHRLTEPTTKALCQAPPTPWRSRCTVNAGLPCCVPVKGSLGGQTCTPLLPHAMGDGPRDCTDGVWRSCTADVYVSPQNAVRMGCPGTESGQNSPKNTNLDQRSQSYRFLPVFSAHFRPFCPPPNMHPSESLCPSVMPRCVRA